MESNKPSDSVDKVKHHIRITMCSRKLKSIERICKNIIFDNNGKNLLIKAD